MIVLPKKSNTTYMQSGYVQNSQSVDQTIEPMAWMGILQQCWTHQKGGEELDLVTFEKFKAETGLSRTAINRYHSAYPDAGMIIKIPNGPKKHGLNY